MCEGMSVGVGECGWVYAWVCGSVNTFQGTPQNLDYGQDHVDSGLNNSVVLISSNQKSCAYIITKGLLLF